VSDPDTDLPDGTETPANPSAKTSDILDDEPVGKYEAIIREILAVERALFFEKRNAKTERQRKLREVIERHTPLREA
jgi:hypothetical protein